MQSHHLNSSSEDVKKLRKSDPDVELTTISSHKPLPRVPYQLSYSLPCLSSIESLVECDIPSPSLSNDQEMSRFLLVDLYLPDFELNQLSSNATATPTSSSNIQDSNRCSSNSTLFEFAQDLSPGTNQNQTHSRPYTVLLPAPVLDHNRLSDETKRFYSAPLRLSSDTVPSTKCSEYCDPSPSKPSTAPHQLGRLCSEVFNAKSSDSALTSCFRSGSGTRPTTPPLSLVPSLSSASTVAGSPSNMFHHSPQELEHMSCVGGPSYANRDHSTSSRPQSPKQLAAHPTSLSQVTARPRNINAPLPTSLFSASYTMATQESTSSDGKKDLPRETYRRPESPPVEVSAFDADSDDESFGFKVLMKNKISLNNLRIPTRSRADSQVTSTPPLLQSKFRSRSEPNTAVFFRPSTPRPGSKSSAISAPRSSSPLVTNSDAKPVFWLFPRPAATESMPSTSKHNTLQTSLPSSTNSDRKASVTSTVSTCTTTRSVVSTASSSPGVLRRRRRNSSLFSASRKASHTASDTNSEPTSVSASASAPASILMGSSPVLQKGKKTVKVVSAKRWRAWARRIFH